MNILIQIYPMSSQNKLKQILKKTKKRTNNNNKIIKCKS